MIVGIAGAGLAAFDAAQHCVLARFHLCRSATLMQSAAQA